TKDEGRRPLILRLSSLHALAGGRCGGRLAHARSAIGRRLHSLEREPSRPDVDAHGIAVADLAGEHETRQRVLDLALDGAPQRARAEDRIVSLAAKIGLG